MKVTIITATYNSQDTLTSALNSVFEQDYNNIEHLVIDGASSDDSIKIIEEFASKNSALKYISEPDKGIYNALNKGLALATGDLIGFVHSDDFLANSSVISNVVKAVKEENLDGVYGNLLYVNRNDTNKVVRNWESKPFSNALLNKGWMPAHPTLFLKKEVYVESGNFDESYNIAADYNFMLSVFKKPSYKFGFLPLVITKMRVGGSSNKKLANIILKSKEDFRAIKTNSLKNPLAILFLKNFSKIKQFI